MLCSNHSKLLEIPPVGLKGKQRDFHIIVRSHNENRQDVPGCYFTKISK